MAPRGPKPKPTHLKLVAGNPGKRRMGHEPKPRDIIPDPPPEIEADALEEWHRMGGQLHRLGLLTEVDRSAFVCYCQAYGRWATAQRAINLLAKQDPVTHGLLARSAKGNAMTNPLIGIANVAARDMMNFAAEFGMTPSARARLGMHAPPIDPKDDEFGGTLWEGSGPPRRR